MACNTSASRVPLQHPVFRCHTAATCCNKTMLSVATRGSTVAAVVTGFAPYLSACGSVTTKSLLRVIKIKKNEKIGNIERGAYIGASKRKTDATLQQSDKMTCNKPGEKILSDTRQHWDGKYVWDRLDQRKTHLSDRGGYALCGKFHKNRKYGVHKRVSDGVSEHRLCSDCLAIYGGGGR